jgi:hypothetical protein
MASNCLTSTTALALSRKLGLSAAGPLCRDLRSKAGMRALIAATKTKRVGTEPESGLLAFEDGDRDPDTINSAFHAVQSIKGAADDAGAAPPAEPGEPDLL